MAMNMPSVNWHNTALPMKHLDNGLMACADPAQLQAICDDLWAERIDACCASSWHACLILSRRKTCGWVSLRHFDFAG